MKLFFGRFLHFFNRIIALSLQPAMLLISLAGVLLIGCVEINDQKTEPISVQLALARPIGTQNDEFPEDIVRLCMSYKCTSVTLIPDVVINRIDLKRLANRRIVKLQPPRRWIDYILIFWNVRNADAHNARVKNYFSNAQIGTVLGANCESTDNIRLMTDYISTKDPQTHLIVCAAESSMICHLRSSCPIAYCVTLYDAVQCIAQIYDTLQYERNPTFAIAYYPAGCKQPDDHRIQEQSSKQKTSVQKTQEHISLSWFEDAKTRICNYALSGDDAFRLLMQYASDNYLLVESSPPPIKRFDICIVLIDNGKLLDVVQWDGLTYRGQCHGGIRSDVEFTKYRVIWFSPFRSTRHP